MKKAQLIKIILSTCIFSLATLTLLFGQQTNPIVLGKARFTIITPELVRMEYATDAKFVDEPTLFANNRKTFFNNFEIDKKENRYTISTSRMKIYFTDDGYPFSQKNISITVLNKPKNIDWLIYMKDDANLGGALSTLDEVEGEVPLEQGLLSKNGWHVIDDGQKEILVNGWLSPRPVNHIRDLYFFGYGQNYKAALKSLTAISGEVPMNRKYVHGSWYCRWWNYTDNDYREIVNGYKAHGFPLDVLVMDMGWHTQKEALKGMAHAGSYGWTGYTWNKKLIPNPSILLKEFKDDGLHITLNDHPHDGIRPHEEQYAPFMKAMGADTTNQNTLLFNAGDKKYMDNFFKYALQPSEKIGVDFWWLDWQQDYVMPFVLGYPNVKHLPWLNYLYFKHSQADDKRGLLFSRWAGWGSQRTPIQFSGDAVASWDMLKFEIPFTSKSSNSGCFFWAHDIGGFYGGRDAELYVRWSQFGLTNSSLRIHSVSDENLDRRPWLWGKQAEDALRIVYRLRSQLMPYIYTSVWQSHKESVPLIRGMYIDYPENKEAYINDQQYLFGDLLLAAPIVSPGKGEKLVGIQKVWFPDGDVWFNIFNNEKFEGGQTKEVSSDIYQTPLFVKGGYPLLMQPYKERMASATLDTLVIKCYPGIINKQQTYTLYEDDGISNEYKNDMQSFTKLGYTQKSNAALVNISAVEGKGYTGQPKSRVYVLQLPLQKAKNVLVNNKKAQFKYDDKTNSTIIITNAVSIGKAVTIETEW
ncbi:DUF5110 domain-containing protein [Pedobacter chinensis]|uniref:DUF5110 domain-containing protein n=1 Tax=Pedobacter chinensis TaxID=2282421 RepID=A0A369Q1I2_9SPHI|nr:glycoside hydrolase family 31 protein [Pedobacter chinensis]RDC58330.1 DUF5110 domain-containing protein [Pedobacter chinensis]